MTQLIIDSVVQWLSYPMTQLIIDSVDNWLRYPMTRLKLTQLGGRLSDDYQKFRRTLSALKQNENCVNFNWRINGYKFWRIIIFKSCLILLKRYLCLIKTWIFGFSGFLYAWFEQFLRANFLINEYLVDWRAKFF